MKKIALVGGGTGGHIMPLLSIYNKLKNNKDFDFFWIGEKQGLEQDIAGQNGIKFYGINAGKLRRYFSLKTLIEPFRIISGIIESLKILKKESPTLIFSKGGFVSLPVAIAAKILGIKLYLHESDTIPGLANKFVGKFASRVYLGFIEASKYFNLKKVKVAGQILNPELFLNKKSNLKENKKTNLLVIAGSQGSTRIFKTILKNSDKFKDFNIEIVLGSLNKGLKSDFEKMKNVKTYEFVTQKTIGTILDRTDIAITRAGATSLAELETFGIKMIIIPLTESANNHQHYNAINFKNKGNIMIEEIELNTLPNLIEAYKGYKKVLGDYKIYNALDIISEDLISA